MGSKLAIYYSDELACSCDRLRIRMCLGLGESAASSRTDISGCANQNGDKVVASVCPYCAVGCGQLVYVKDEKIIDIEGDPARRFRMDACVLRARRRFSWSPVQHRVTDVLYRQPYGTEWEKIPLEQAMDMVAERVKKTRDAHLGRQEQRRRRRSGARWASRTWAAPRSTTKRTI